MIVYPDGWFLLEEMNFFGMEGVGVEWITAMPIVVGVSSSSCILLEAGKEEVARRLLQVCNSLDLMLRSEWSAPPPLMTPGQPAVTTLQGKWAV
jgi:hypothetical protein